MSNKAVYGLGSKTIEELEAIINSDKYDELTIENAKEVLDYKKNEADRENQSEEPFSRFEAAILKEVKNQSKDIRGIKNSVLFFVVLTVASMVVSLIFWLTVFSETNPLR